MLPLSWALPAAPQAVTPPAPAACDEHASAVSVTDFGAHGDRAGDNTQAFQRALAHATQCGIRTVEVPAGDYDFSVSGPSRGLLLPSNIVLLGDGAGQSVLRVTGDAPGANFASLFWARNQDQIEIRGLSFIGNNVPVHDAAGRPLNSYGTALTVALDAAPAAGLGVPRSLAHFLIADCSFENFNGAAWISVINYNDRFVIDDIEIRDNHFTSHEGNAINPASIAYPANAISVMGSQTSAAGLVTNVRIHGNTIEARHLKGGVAIWSGVRGATVSDNNILDAGADPAIPDNTGAYAVTVYNNAYFHDAAHAYGAPMGGILPDDVHVERNRIANPRSCGVYAASADRLWVVDNEISGQTDGQNWTLPKGAIALNHPHEATVTGNRISTSHIGMTLLPADHGRIIESGNTISAVPPGGVRIFPARPAN